jgi:ABC-type multidrug transport system ATPase subunit/ABC-type multidrug transport system permease subunit
MNTMNQNSHGTEWLVEVAGLVKAFRPNGPAALDHLDARVPARAITGLVGPDGAGKTTLMRMLAGLLLPTSGDIRVFGFDPTAQPEEIRSRIGYMPQRFGLYEDLSVIQNLRLYAELRGVIGNEREATFERLLTFTDLKRFQGRKAGALSGGMKQKLALACALVSKPELLLLDEPSVGVDPISRRDLWKIVQELVADGIGVIWSTAYLDEAELCDAVILLHEGKTIFDGPPKELTDRVRSRTFQLRVADNRRKILAEALRSPAVVDGVVQGDHVRLVLNDSGARDEIERFADDRCLRAVPPRFEDAFVDTLGGLPKEESLLAGTTPHRQHEGGAVIEAKGLTKRFGNFVATDQVSFSVKRSEIFGLLGPNGAGKSTTFKMLCGLLEPSAGTARIAGIDFRRSASAARNRIGYMAQKFSLYGDLTLKQNLDFFSGVYGLSGQQRTSAIDRMIHAFGFDRYLGTPSGQLPLGFKQRLAMACALMHEPDVLFLDEPTSGVDPITRRQFWLQINGLVEKGVTVMVTTHFMDEAEYCDRIGLVYRGKLIALDTPDALKCSVRSPDLPEPTMEQTFIRIIQRFDTADEPSFNQMDTQIGQKVQPQIQTLTGLPMNSNAKKFSGRRLGALVRKELIQIVNDPSSILIAFILPVMLLFLFGYAVSLDSTRIRVGVVMEERSPESESLLVSLRNSPYLDVTASFDRGFLEREMVAGRLRALLVIPIDFSRRLYSTDNPPLQIIGDGSEPNTATFAENYLEAVVSLWLQQRGMETGAPVNKLIDVETRNWFNPSLESKNYLVPGSIAIIMTMIGTLLTALVVAREWERGTMEAMMATPVTIQELVLGKLIPYFLLGLGSMLFCTVVAVSIFHTPLRGSIVSLFLVTSLFLAGALGLGLLVSTLSKSQFVAGQFAIILGFLPGFQLSGFLFEISSMPKIVQLLTWLFPARYFVQALQTIFLAGDIWRIVLFNSLVLGGFATLFFVLTARVTHKRLA